jgi:actin-related protein 5
MAITSVQSILPARVTVNASEQGAVKPPPKISNAQDFPFKGYQPPQPEGYEQSKSRPNTSAIVIDNGKSSHTTTIDSRDVLTLDSR